MIHHIDAYIASKSFAWAPTTLDSERSRLVSLSSYLTGDASALYAHLADTVKPYTIVTTWTRVVAFWDHLLHTGAMTGVNPYKAFRATNARLFKHKYQPKQLSITFDQARDLVNNIQPEEIRQSCMAMLFGGLRLHEVGRQVDGSITGKGSKVRPYFGPDCPTLSRDSIRILRKELKKHGLTPHDLRRLCATELVSKGLVEADLLKIMGWGSILTAKAYLQPKQNEQLQVLVNSLRTQ